MKKTLYRSFVILVMCVCVVNASFPPKAQAGSTFVMPGETITGQGKYNLGPDSQTENNVYKYIKPSNVDEIIAICKKYSDKNTVTGVRNQIDWMKQLYFAAGDDFVGGLELGDVLLISLLNHSNINKTLMMSKYSTSDINREVAKLISTGAEGYADVKAIAEATGLSEKDVRSILEKIGNGSVTEKTIAAGKSQSKFTNRGAYANNQAAKQKKVWDYLTAEVNRMTKDEDALAILCEDLGTGYVTNLMAGQNLDQYKVELYKKQLAKTLDSVIESDNPYSVATYDITSSEAYKVTKKTRSVLSKVFSYEVGAAKDELPEELREFWDKCLENGVLSESEAREYLILSGEYQTGEHGIGEAAKQLIKGYEHLKGFKSALDKAGEAIGAIEKVKKAEEYLEYWATNYAEQELLLDYMIESLADSGADMEMLVAAEELKQNYESKLDGTFDKVYDALIDKGIDTVKSTFPPLGIAEAVISFSGMVTGADKKVAALETGFAMQGICDQALADYEKAVRAIQKNSNPSDEEVSRAVYAFETARQSMISYYKALIVLAETDAQKSEYASVLNKLEQAEFGYVTVSLPFGGGGVGSR